MSGNCPVVEGLALLLMVVCAVALAPLLWEVCDRRGTVARLAPAGDPVMNLPSGGDRTGDADLVAFLTSVARALRSGSSAAKAIIEAPSTCTDMALVQENLRRGAPVGGALSLPHPHVRLLATCMHGDVLSAAALDLAVSHERFRLRTESGISVAVAQARRSARVLTLFPFLFLAVAGTLSPAVRSGVASPVIVGALTAGCVLNMVGRLWIRRLVALAARPEPRLALASTIADTCAVHLAAGGSVTGCFEKLAPDIPSCAEVAALLHSGHFLAEALRPLENVAPRVSRTLLDAHRDGLPVIGEMTRLAGDLGRANAAHIQSRIAEVSVRSTTPLVLCVLPSFLLIAVAPLALAALAGLSMPAL